MSKKLVFDVTDANTIIDSDSVGAYVRSSDGSLVTSTTDGGKERLDVSTDIGKNEDSAHVSGDKGVMALVVRSDAGGSLVDTDGDYSALQVDATGALRVNATVNVDANSDYAEDSAHTSGDIGGYVLAVRQDTLAASVSLDGDYGSFKIDSVGSLYTRDSIAAGILTTIDADTSEIAVDIAAIEVEQLAQGVVLDAIAVDTGVIAGDTTSIDASITALSKAEDSIHVSGDQGIMGLSVRNDTLSSLVSASGDYAPLQVNAIGALYTHISGSEELTVNDAALANTAILASADTLALAGTAETVVATNLAARKYLYVYNDDNRTVYVGGSGVDTATGFPLSPSAHMEMRVGAAVDVFYDSNKTGHKIRTLELS